jgi:hypothetical protein
VSCVCDEILTTFFIKIANLVGKKSPKFGTIALTPAPTTTGTVTRLGEFSPIGQLFSTGFENKRWSTACWSTYLFLSKELCIDFDKKRLGLHFERFFHKVVWSHGLPDFSWYLHETKTGKNVPNEHKMYQMVIKYPK